MPSYTKCVNCKLRDVTTKTIASRIRLNQMETRVEQNGESLTCTFKIARILPEFLPLNAGVGINMAK